MTLRVVPKGRFSLRTVATAQRVRILALLAGPPLTVAEIAQAVGVRASAVRHHLRQLVAAGVLTLEGEGDKRRYRQSEPAPMWLTDDDEERLAALLAFATDVHRRWAKADVGATGVTFDGELWVDPRAWGQVCEQVRSAVETLREAAHPPHTEGTLHVSGTARFFAMREPNEPREE